MTNEFNNSNFSTVVLLTLKELRLERNIHQGAFAQGFGKTPSAWNKIENGQSSLSIDAFYSACATMGLSAPYVMSIIDKLIFIFNRNGFFFLTTALEEGKDDLLQLIRSYYNSKGYEKLKSPPLMQIINISTLNNPYSTNAMEALPTIIQYCCDPKYRQRLDDGLV